MNLQKKGPDKTRERNFETLNEPKFEKRSAIMLREIKEKKERGEIDDEVFRLLKKGL